MRGGVDGAPARGTDSQARFQGRPACIPARHWSAPAWTSHRVSALVLLPRRRQTIGPPPTALDAPFLSLCRVALPWPPCLSLACRAAKTSPPGARFYPLFTPYFPYKRLAGMSPAGARLSLAPIQGTRQPGPARDKLLKMSRLLSRDRLALLRSFRTTMLGKLPILVGYPARA